MKTMGYRRYGNQFFFSMFVVGVSAQECSER